MAVRKNDLPLGVYRKHGDIGKPYSSRIYLHIGDFATPKDAHEAFTYARSQLPKLKEIIKRRNNTRSIDDALELVSSILDWETTIRDLNAKIVAGLLATVCKEPKGEEDCA